MRAASFALLLSAVGCSDPEPCAGVACDACPPAIQIEIDAPAGSEEPAITGAIELSCAPRSGGWACAASTAPVGTYTFEVSLGSAIASVTVELRAGGGGCCACATTSDIARLDLRAPAADGGARDAGDGLPDGGAPDAGDALGDGGGEDAAVADGGAGGGADAAAGDAGGACDPSRVEFPMGGTLAPGTLCDDVLACVPSSAVASVQAATVFDCTPGAGEPSCAAGEQSCRYADPAGPSVLDEAEVANICALTVHTPPPSRVVCRVYL